MTPTRIALLAAAGVLVALPFGCEPESGSGFESPSLLSEVPRVSQCSSFAAGCATDSGPQGPNAIASGDFDNDGLIDLVLLNGVTEDVSILFNIGAGVLAPAVTFDFGSKASIAPRVSATDVDGDGDLDLILLTRTIDFLSLTAPGNVTLLRNDGTGGFQTSEQFAVGDSPFDFVVGDVNNDGSPDLVVANLFDLSVLINNGNGVFLESQRIPAGDFGPSSVVLFDADADGDLDLAVPLGNFFDPAAVLILLNLGDGTFQTPLVTGSFSRDLTVADLDGDFDVDFAVAYSDSQTNNDSGGISLFINDGHAMFSTSDIALNGFLPQRIENGDLDLDGDRDLVFVGGDGSIRFLLNEGGGTFASPIRLPLDFLAEDFTLADFDNDNDLDIFATHRVDTFCQPNSLASILVNDGLVFSRAVDITIGRIRNRPVAADLDGDNDIDVVFGIGRLGSRCPQDFLTSVITNNGFLSFNSPINFSPGAGPLAVIDLTGDALPEIAVVDRKTAQLTVLLNQGSAAFAAGPHAATGDFIASIATADFDNDGDADIAVGAFPGGINVFRNDGNGNLAVAELYTAGGEPGAIKAADIDGDGDQDLVALDFTTNLVFLLKNRGDGTFVSTPHVGSLPFDVLAADFNGDGREDLAVISTGSNSIDVLLNEGGGAFAPAASVPVGRAPVNAVISDLDGDGDLDIALVVAFADEVVVLLNHGNGTFAAPRSIATGATPVSITAADLNSDGRIDLAVVFLDLNKGVILLNDGLANFTPVQ